MSIDDFCDGELVNLGFKDDIEKRGNDDDEKSPKGKTLHGHTETHLEKK